MMMSMENIIKTTNELSFFSNHITDRVKLSHTRKFKFPKLKVFNPTSPNFQAITLTCNPVKAGAWNMEQAKCQTKVKGNSAKYQQCELNFPTCGVTIQVGINSCRCWTRIPN